MIISKLLATRLKVVLDPFDDESQFTFFMERQILNGVLIASKAI